MKLATIIVAASVAGFGIRDSGLAWAAESRIPTLCQAEEVKVATSTIDLRLVGCGEGFPDNLLWHLDRADSLTGALDQSTTRRATGKGAVVYICDTGIMQVHDEFMRAEGSVVIAGIDANARGGGCANPALSPCWSIDSILAIETHGTAVASIVAGRNTGVAPDAKIVSMYAESAANDIDRWLKMFDAIIQHAWNPTTPPFRTAIINMSFVPNLASANDPKFPQFEAKMRQMIGGVDANGDPDPNGKRFLFVTIAGNQTTTGDQCDKDMNSNVYPGILGSSIDGLITVGGIDSTNHLWDRSCRGPAVDVLAPAADMFVASISAHDHYRSGAPFGGYPLNSGTSYASPYVAGIAALLLEENPELTPQQLEMAIKGIASHVANADETAAAGRVAIFDLVSKLPRRRVIHH
ncbi:MAG TPA: S8 family serine peptidase [Thermoanaerobaculia bacterium]|nr:S8 family serine peptidase [Thermoanaerobaculia bacterium]